MLHSCFGVVGSVRVALHSSLLRLFFLCIISFTLSFVLRDVVVAARCYYAELVFSESL